MVQCLRFDVWVTEVPSASDDNPRMSCSDKSRLVLGTEQDEVPQHECDLILAHFFTKHVLERVAIERDPFVVRNPSWGALD